MPPPNIQYGSEGGDLISELPTDETPPSEQEFQVINTLFKKNGNMLKKIGSEFKDVVIVGVLFVIFSTEFVDKLIKKIPIAASSPYFLLLIKTVILMSLFWIIKYFYLSKSC